MRPGVCCRPHPAGSPTRAGLQIRAARLNPLRERANRLLDAGLVNVGDVEAALADLSARDAAGRFLSVHLLYVVAGTVGSRIPAHTTPRGATMDAVEPRVFAGEQMNRNSARPHAASSSVRRFSSR